jgi:hypothetical protein
MELTAQKKRTTIEKNGWKESDFINPVLFIYQTVCNSLKLSIVFSFNRTQSYLYLTEII